MSDTMQIWDPRRAAVSAHLDIASALLPLKDSEILSLAIGAGDIAPAIAVAVKSATVTVLETEGATDDPPPLSNLTYKAGDADRIPAEDESFDIVIVNGLLSRIPEDRRSPALREIRRVLRPGGLAYIAEPTPGGAFNEISRVFKDEKQDRLATFELVRGTVSSGAMVLVEQKFFQMSVVIPDFAAVERGYVPPDARISGAQKSEARKKFERHVGPKGAAFQIPMRIDLLRKSD
ncbi:MAG: methyltransferase domain-containing protein [Rhodospirillaceae bacterium]|nr:methyltransferase domain-containing protein [Rhodospirillaceae bacterium]